MKKPLMVVAALLVAAVPARYAHDAAEKRKDRAEAAAAKDRAALVSREAVAEAERSGRHRDFMALLARQKEEMARLNERHDREKIADRISDNIRPGSAQHHGTKQWDEFQALIKKHEEEVAEFKQENPEP